MKSYTQTLLLIFSALGLLFQGCSTLDTASGDRTVTYDKDFDTMVETVEQAIQGSALEINFARKSDAGDKYTIVFNARGHVNTQSVQQDQGEVIVESIEDNKTRVIINNPEYHFSVPSNQRREYDEELKNKIDNILNG